MPAGIVRSKPSSTGRSLPGYANVTSRKRISRAGRPSARRGACRETASAPRSPMAGSRRSTAATGAEAPSSAQLMPPKAMALTPTATCANTTTCPRSSRPEAAADASDQKTATLAVRHEQQAPGERLLPQARRLVLEPVQQRPLAHEPLHRPVGQAEEAQLLRRGRIHGEPVGVLRVPLRLADRLGVSVAPDRALPQQPVRAEPRPGQHEGRPPRVAEQDDRGGEPRDDQDEPRGDELDVDVHGRPGHSRVELPSHGQVGGELRVLEVPHPRRPHARFGQPVIEPGRHPAPEVGADRLVDRVEHLQEDEHHPDDRERRRQPLAPLHRPDEGPHGNGEPRRQQAAQEKDGPPGKRQPSVRPGQDGKELPLRPLTQSTQHGERSAVSCHPARMRRPHLHPQIPMGCPRCRTARSDTSSGRSA